MFKRWLYFLFALALAGGVQAQGATVSPPVQSEFSRAELLVHAPNGVTPGQPLWLGLQITHAPDWHTYWKNPGDSGLPTELEWQLPAGITPGDIEWPTPRKFPLGDLANYGYDGTVLLPIPLRVGADFQGQTLQAEVLASWLICRKECVPEEAHFQVRIPAQLSTAAHAAAFEAAWSAVPIEQAPGNSRLHVTSDGLEVVLTGLPPEWRTRPLELFPEKAGLIEPGAAWQQRWDNGVWHATIPLSRFRADSPDTVALVVAPANPPGTGPGLRGVRMEVPVPDGWPPVAQAGSGASAALQAALAENAARAAAATGPSTTTLTLWAALLGALVGGMILNLMPCVFPILAIKVLAFSQQGNNHGAHRVGGLAYTAGVVLSFIALGGLLLALRAAGEQLGWGFQLQNPVVVASLAVLFTVIGLNLAGLFEFGHILPSSVASLQARNPTADAFLTGVLATAVASPCTAPFMGASLGLAIALPTGQALAVFAVLGLGMALPYLLASWVPAIARALPRPGPWMETFRQLMAFPMFATVVWLLWVLGQQSGIDGAAALLMLLVVLALLIWALNRGGKVRTVLGPLSLLGLAWLLWAIGPTVTRLQDSVASFAPTSIEGVAWEAWSPQREADLLAQGRPVFVDYTAAWCVTCQYNKRTVLNHPDVLQTFADKRVVLLRADWTRRDPVISASLAALGRSGIPVYVLHGPGRTPLILSEILTVEEVRSAVQQLSL
ncbi:protein-disulfide reductase DsbD family protein [Tepidicella baoligensis]|uniref:protein-disulfide reductase DsbD family protein n=1 Tax=Tepidicella baoligensis TaxID=2707016 RepID=UPI0015D9EADC|nr:thioredoxin family protein [Tepidicella baoligensis]